MDEKEEMYESSWVMHGEPPNVWYELVYEYSYYYYFKNDDGDNLNHRTHALNGYGATSPLSHASEQLGSGEGESIYYHFDCRNVLRNHYYPGSMYVFGGVAEEYGAYLNQDNFNTENFNQSTIWVGQKSSFVGNVYNAAVDASAAFINIFDDGSGAPYLWENADEFCQFYPTNLISANPEGDLIEGELYNKIMPLCICT